MTPPSDDSRRRSDMSLADYRLSSGHWKRYIAALLVLVGATLASYLVARNHVNQDLEESRLALAEDGQVLVDTIQLTFSRLESRMKAVAGLFRASDEITVADFNQFADDLGMLPGMRGYGYAVFMTDAELAGWRNGEALPQYGDESFDSTGNVTEDDGLLPTHAVVVYFFGRDLMDRPEGLDLMSEPRRAAAVTRAVESESVAFTPFLRLLDETDGDGMVGFLPIRDPNGLDVMEGLVAVPVDLSNLLTWALPTEVAEDIAWQISDRASATEVGSRHSDDDRVWSDEVKFGDREWTVAVTSLEFTSAGSLNPITLTIGLVVGLLGGLALLVVGAARDQSRARRELESVLHVKNRFLATVSHELRTPLAGVVGFLHAALDPTTTDDANRRDLVALAATQADEMVAIIEDLLTVAKADVTELNVTAKPTDLAAEISAVVRSVTDPVTVEIGTGDGRVWADPARLRQVLRNLIRNAFRHGAPPVTIRAFESEYGVEIHVMDHGPGVPVDRIDRLFRPFEPLDPQGTKPQSLGLGLWISQRLLRLMDGDLTYCAEPAPTFVIKLRRAAPDAIPVREVPVAVGV